MDGKAGDVTLKLLLALTIVLLLANLVVLLSRPATAADVVGRYAISAFAWVEPDGDVDSGYYVIDTTSGSVSSYNAP